MASSHILFFLFIHCKFSDSYSFFPTIFVKYVESEKMTYYSLCRWKGNLSIQGSRTCISNWNILHHVLFPDVRTFEVILISSFYISVVAWSSPLFMYLRRYLSIVIWFCRTPPHLCVLHTLPVDFHCMRLSVDVCVRLRPSDQFLHVFALCLVVAETLASSPAGCSSGRSLARRLLLLERLLHGR
jgi:hypothetical protein